LIAIGTIGLLWIEPARFTPLNPSGQPLLPALSGVAALTLWAFLGLESATVPAANVIDPERTIPRATIFGVIVTAVIYILSTAAIIGAMPREALQNSGAPFAEAARSMWGGWAYYAVGAGAVISAFGTLNGWMLLAGQVPMAAADDALFPRVFGRRNRNGVPANAMIISAVLITIILALNYSGSSGLVETFNFIILLATLSSLDALASRGATAAPAAAAPPAVAPRVASPPPAPAAPAVESASAPFDAEIAAIFAEEAAEILDNSEGALQDVRQRQDQASVVVLQRFLHTLKGGARMAGVVAMGDLSHALETLLARVVDGHSRPTSAALDLVQRGLDELQHMRDAIDAGRLASAPSGLVAELEGYAEPAAALNHDETLTET